MPAREIIGYTLALAGLGCAVTAAALQGGAVAAWGAAGAGSTNGDEMTIGYTCGCTSETCRQHGCQAMKQQGIGGGGGGTGGTRGWICPQCGAGVSPFTDRCPCTVRPPMHPSVGTGTITVPFAPSTSIISGGAGGGLGSTLT